MADFRTKIAPTGQLPFCHMKGNAGRIVEEWETEARVLDDETIQLAKEFCETYPPAVAKLSDLFTRIAAHRQRISALHQRRPAGVESVRDPELSRLV